jgi:hypothetical protein
MPDKSTVEKLLDRAPLAVVIIGVVVFIIGAAGGLPVGNPPLQITDVYWRIALGAMGVILSGIGLRLLASEDGFSGRGRIRRFDRPEDALRYTLKRIRGAKKSVCDLTWEEPFKATLVFAADDIEDYLSIIEEVSRRIRYREIMVFCQSEARVRKVRRLIETAGKYYQLAGYADLPEEAPPRWQFVIIDNEEVILHDLAIRQADVVDYFRRYYDALWIAATPIKVGDIGPNLELLEEAEKRINKAELTSPTSVVEGGKPRRGVVNLQDVMYGSSCLPLGSGPNRIFHAQCPYVLPVCFKSPIRSEYTYVVVGTRVEDPNTDDEGSRIITEPSLPVHSISSVTVRRGRWYQLTSQTPLKSIRFGSGPRIENFAVVEAEIHPVRAWNKHSPVIVPGNRSRAYGLAVTEQKGSSIWFVSIDDQQFTFNEKLGCHFVEFVLPEGRQHSLTFGYQEGAWGIACAFFAF